MLRRVLVCWEKVKNRILCSSSKKVIVVIQCLLLSTVPMPPGAQKKSKTDTNKICKEGVRRSVRSSQVKRRIVSACVLCCCCCLLCFFVLSHNFTASQPLLDERTRACSGPFDVERVQWMHLLNCECIAEHSVSSSNSRRAFRKQKKKRKPKKIAARASLTRRTRRHSPVRRLGVTWPRVPGRGVTRTAGDASSIKSGHVRWLSSLRVEMNRWKLERLRSFFHFHFPLAASKGSGSCVRGGARCPFTEADL